MFLSGRRLPGSAGRRFTVILETYGSADAHAARKSTCCNLISVQLRILSFCALHALHLLSLSSVHSFWLTHVSSFIVSFQYFSFPLVNLWIHLPTYTLLTTITKVPEALVVYRHTGGSLVARTPQKVLTEIRLRAFEEQVMVKRKTYFLASVNLFLLHFSPFSLVVRSF
jgi:hypothetical protein